MIVALIVCGYLLISISVWSIGALGVGTRMSDTRREGAAQNAQKGFHSQFEYDDYLAYRTGVAGLLIFATGLLWPILVPVYLGYHKGAHIDAELAGRDAEDREYRGETA